MSYTVTFTANLTSFTKVNEIRVTVEQKLHKQVKTN